VDTKSSQEFELSMEVQAAGCLNAEQKGRLFGMLTQYKEYRASKPRQKQPF
jgi:hypothetical protein